MNRLLGNLFGIGTRRQWCYGLGLTAASLALIVLPAATRLRGSLRNFQRIKATYTMKLSWAGKKGELARRVKEQEAAAAKLDAMQLHGGGIAEFTQALAGEARAVGCAARSIQPAEPRVLPRPDAKGAGGGAKTGKAEKPQVQFVEWPVRVVLQGEYSQVTALLQRLRSDVRYVRLTRLQIRPDEESRERLNCDLELAGYGLRAQPGGS